MPNYGKQTMSTKPMLKSTYDFISLVYCFIVCLICPLAVRDIFCTPMALI